MTGDFEFLFECNDFLCLLSLANYNLEQEDLFFFDGLSEYDVRKNGE